jgi:hypothetical protein
MKNVTNLKIKRKNVTGCKIGVVVALGERRVIRGRRGYDGGCGEDRRGGDRVQRSENGEDNRKENQTMPEAEQHSQQENLRNNNAKFFQMYDIYEIVTFTSSFANPYSLSMDPNAENLKI